jgi:hypothetical protein
MEIAKKITQVIPAEIQVTESNDLRSYRVNSDKLLATGFKPAKTVDDAILEIRAEYKRGNLKDEDHFYNLRWMKRMLS